MVYFISADDDDDAKVAPAQDETSFDPFATIAGDDAFVANFAEDSKATHDAKPGTVRHQTIMYYKKTSISTYTNIQAR